MASGPPDDGSILPTGWTWGDIGHGLLDVAGLVPGYGEAADVANALWYTGEDKYLEAGLSLISTVPIVGDAIGKGGKLVGKLGGPALKKLVLLLKKADFAAALAPFRKNKKLAPHIDKMIAALEKWRDELIDKATGCQSCKAKLAKTTTRSIIDATVVKTKDGSILRAQHVADGSGDKIAVIGRTMTGVREYADALRKQGLSVELFDGPVIPAFAKAQMDLLTDGGRWLTNNELMKTAMYAQNKAWAEKLVREGYTVVDIGNYANKGFSPFYAIERATIFAKKGP